MFATLATSIVQDPGSLAHQVAGLVFRHVLGEAPGYACLRVIDCPDSFALRQLMSELRRALSRIHHQRYGQGLEYYSLGRFDQKKTTRLHLDGGPSCSFLMLGYEPSEVTSRFTISDYSHCADSQDLTPAQFLHDQNPMFSETGRAALLPYTRNIEDWDDREYRIVIVNNGSLEANTPLPGLGVMHGAEILFDPGSGSGRIINSTMFVPESEAHTNPATALTTFLTTREIAGQLL